MPTSNPSNNNQKKSDEIKLEKIISKLQKEIESLSYEDSIKELDILLQEFQSESIPIEDLQKKYLKGKIYLQHCQNLLKEVEQTVINLDLENPIV